MSNDYKIAIVGATGAVGQEILKILEERSFPVNKLKVLASPRSEGKKINFRGEELTVRAAVPDSFKGVEIAFFAGGGSISENLVPEAVKRGAVAVDNSSVFRLNPDIPLVVPEVNPEDVCWHKGIIANPNCSTIIMVVPLKPLHDKAKIKRIIASTYQAVSGAGRDAIEELLTQSKQILAGEEVNPKIFAYPIAFNLIPHIDVFGDNGYSREEMKLLLETRKIFHDTEINISATTVRVPVVRCHSESLNIETEKKLSPDEARSILSKASGVVVQDDPEKLCYPMPVAAADQDKVLVGRIREDYTHASALKLWVVADQLRKGAATNAVQIAELLIQRGLV